MKCLHIPTSEEAMSCIVSACSLFVTPGIHCFSFDPYLKNTGGHLCPYKNHVEDDRARNVDGPTALDDVPPENPSAMRIDLTTMDLLSSTLVQ
jgi:hypothetical protein